MRPISKETVLAVVKYRLNGVSIEDTAEKLDISVATVNKYIKMHKSGTMYAPRVTMPFKARGLGTYTDGKYKHVDDTGKTTKAYTLWCHMLRSCGDKSHKEFAMYGSKGYTVDPTWLEFQVFATWHASQKTVSQSIEFKDDESKVFGPTTCYLLTAAEWRARRTAKHYTLLSPDNEIVYIHNVNKWCRDNPQYNLLPSCIYALADGSRTHYKQWRMYGTKKPR